MTDNTNESQAEPSFSELLALSGFAPEQWLALDDARKQEWIRVWQVKQMEGTPLELADFAGVTVERLERTYDDASLSRLQSQFVNHRKQAEAAQ